MKKVLLFIVAVVMACSCQKEIESVTPEASQQFSFKASIEGLDTKASINDSYQFVWAEADKIGVFVNDYEVKNQAFTLVGEGGSTSGEFQRDQGEFTSTAATAAFFPWGNDNNASDNGNMYFQLLETYQNYTSGKMLTPLVAQVSYQGGEYAPIEFKHAGAAVKVTINNLPVGAKSIGMTVDGQQVWGWYHIPITQAGTETIALNEGQAADGKNSIWLHFDGDAPVKPYTFVFPVPALTTPKLKFQLYDENNVLVWEKKLKAQANDIGRADILEMPAIDIEPYSKFNAISTYYVHGTLSGSNEEYKDYKMVTDGSKSIAKGLTFSAGGKFTVTNGTTYIPEGYGNDWVVNTAGTYDIIFDPSGATTADKIKVVASKCPYPNAEADVTLYFTLDDNIDFTDLKLCCEAIGTDAWPGTSLDLSNTETIMLKTYYKYVTKASNVWGKTPNLYLYGVSTSNWATQASPADFRSNKKEFFFDLGSDRYGTVTQLSGRPTPPKPVAITIDGSTGDWDKLSAKWTSGTNDRITAWKATYDKDNIYIYMEIAEAYAKSGKYSSYVEAAFDVDNKSTTPTGVTTDYGFGTGWEAIAIVFPFTNSSGSDVVLANDVNDSHLDKPFGTSVGTVTSKGNLTGGVVYLEFAVSRTTIGAPSSGPVLIKVGGGSHLLDGQYLFIE